MLAAVYMQIGHLEIPPCEIEIPKPSYSHVDRMFLNDMKGYDKLEHIISYLRSIRE